jgi:hypothetical protein
VARPDAYVYKEVTRWPSWAALLVWGASLAALLGIGGALVTIVGRYGLIGLVTGEGAAYLATGVMVLLAPLVLHWLFGRLTIGVGTDEVVAHFGSGPIRKRIPFAHIKGVRSVKYNPIREFGGWGIRGMGTKRAWTIRGDQAVVLHLRDGVHLHLGSETPARLEERIETAMDLQRGSEES